MSLRTLTGPYANRTDAGRRLAKALALYGRPHPLVLGLPRGGIPVAVQVAESLGAELDALIVRKIGSPANRECAIGAIGEDGIRVIDHAACRRLRLSDEEIEQLVQAERVELQRRIELYRRGSRRLGIAGRNVIIVDDGLATGATAAAAVKVARHFGAQHITLAVPVGSAPAVDDLRSMADDVVCPLVPADFAAVGQFFSDFAQVPDAEVVRMLSEHPRGPTRRAQAAVLDEAVAVPVDGGQVAGRLTIPFAPHLLVVFAHGSGSSHLSPRNQSVARALEAAGIATLLVDSFTPGEGPDVSLDVPTMVRRILAAARWAQALPDAAGLPIGLHGSSSGGALALAAAAEAPGLVQCVVTRSGRPDLVQRWLPQIEAPTLLIVGARDLHVLELNRQAAAQMRCRALLEVVRGAGHLFDEPGTLQQASRLAQSWFLSNGQVRARVS